MENKKVLSMIASAAKISAKVGSKSACGLLTYQPKMPEKLKVK